MIRHKIAVPFCFLVLFSNFATANAEQYAVLIGVQEYDRTEFNSLKYTENDINGLAEVLFENGFNRRNVFTLTQSRGAKRTRFLPTANNIRKELNLVIENLEADDSIIVAFSGHGVQFNDDAENYFCPVDAKLAERETLIALTEVYNKLEASRARHRVLLVDACRNDPQSALSKSSRRIVLEPVTERKPPTVEGGTVALFSCSPTEQSFEDPDLEHGIFFNFVIEGLKGSADLVKDDKITFEELVAFTRKKVKDYSSFEMGIAQVPSSLTGNKNIGSVLVAILKTSENNLAKRTWRPKWKFTKGQKFEIGIVISGTNRQVLNGVEQNLNFGGKYFVDWTVDSVNDDHFNITLEIKRIVMDFGIGTSFDTDSPDADKLNPLSMWLNRKFQCELDHIGRATNIRISTIGNNAEIDGQQNQNEFELFFKEVAECAILPDRPSQLGQSWRYAEIRQQPTLNIGLDTFFSIVDVDQQNNGPILKIDFVSDVTLANTNESEVAVDLKDFQKTGTLNFDHHSGKLVSRTTNDYMLIHSENDIEKVELEIQLKTELTMKEAVTTK